MPQVTLRTSVDGREETVSQYMCDWPGCPYEGIYLFTVSPELKLRALLCEEHAALIAKRGGH